MNTNHVKALAHPLRVAILQDLGDRTASPSELAETLGVPLSHLSYHVRMLVALDLIELKRTRPRRGAIKHYYAAKPAAGDALAAAGLLAAEAPPLELVARAKSLAQQALDRYPDEPHGIDTLEEAIELLGRVELELERDDEDAEVPA